MHVHECNKLVGEINLSVTEDSEDWPRKSGELAIGARNIKTKSMTYCGERPEL